MSLARAVTAAATLLLAAGSASAADELSRAREAVRAWQQAVRQGPLEGAWLALRELGAHDRPLAADAVLEALASAPCAFRPAARGALATYRDPATLEHLLRRGLGHRNATVRTHVLLALSEGRPDGLDWRSAAVDALRDKEAAVRAAAVSALGRAREVAVLEQVLARLSDPSERVRQELPEALVRLAPARALPLLAQLGQDPRWRVRLGVVRAATLLASPAAAVLLVDMLEREDGRLREDLLDALRTITQRDFGLSLPAWRRYLETADPEAWRMLDAPAERAPRPTVTRYWGLGTLSRCFVLVTDLSGSMGAAATDRYEPAPETRLERTQGQLRQLLGGLDESVRFNLLTFHDQVQSWKPRLLAADDAARRAALAEVERYRADGGTNLFGALEAAFTLAEQALDSTEDGPDTVFLLSDGEASTGSLTDPALLLEYARERNRDLHLRIHCVSLSSTAAPRDFLERLAARTGGQSVQPTH